MIIRSAAASWAILFALIHVYWLAGGRVGLPADLFLAPGGPLFAAAMLAVPLLAAAAFAVSRGLLARARHLRAISLIYCCLLSLFAFVHAVPPLLEATFLMAQGEPVLDGRDLYILGLYEPNWLLGGSLFAVALITSRQSRPAASRAMTDEPP